MFEAMTYEYILQRMKDRVTVLYPNLDMREGSIMFNALAPAAMELAQAYINLDLVLNESFVSTASRDSLLKLCEQMGIDTAQFSATYCTAKGMFDVPIDLNTRWNCGLYNYTVTEQLDDEDIYFVYKLTCETAGSEPNSNIGELTPIDYVNNNMTYAVIDSVITTGQDEQTDDEVRNYYIEHINDTPGDGNVAQYEEWCDEYEGIGNYKIFPLWNGANTVKVSILDEDNEPVSDEFKATVQEYFDPDVTGMGDGVAPIGAFVTVSTPTYKNVTVSATITIESSEYDTDEIKAVLTETLQQHFRDISYEKDSVSYFSVASVLMNISVVENVSDLLLNAGSTDVALADEEIPNLSSATWSVVALS